MIVEVLKEEGHYEALLGMALSYYDESEPLDEWWTSERYLKACKRAEILAGKGHGHDKFLRQIQLWVMIYAPRYWWSEFDTYKVGTTAQSASTMHTLKRGVTSEMFARPELVDIDGINAAIKAGASIDVLKGLLPESFMQRRIVTMNYATLSNIINQRHDHRLPEWQVFCDEMVKQVDFPEYLPTKLLR